MEDIGKTNDCRVSILDVTGAGNGRKERIRDGVNRTQNAAWE